MLIMVILVQYSLWMFSRRKYVFHETRVVESMHQFSSIPFLEQFYDQLSEKLMLYFNTNVSHLKDSLLFSVSRGSLVQLHLQNHSS
jgi:hypothetical protein